MAGSGPPQPALVRAAVPADAAAIARIHVLAWQWTYAGLVPPGGLKALSIEERAGQWRSGLEATRPERVVRVAERDGEVVGFSHGGPARDRDLGERAGEVYTLYVLREVLGTGVGGALFDAVTRALRDAGRDPLVLWVAQRNRLGRAFYERQGWRPDGHRTWESFVGRRRYEVRYRTVGSSGRAVESSAGLGPG